MKRMDRYNDTSTQTRASRSNNNKELYENIGSNTRYTSFTDVVNANAIDLSNTKNYNKRENYHKIKEYENVVYTPKSKKELDDFKYLYKEQENKVYDINSVLEEARKNRLDKDALEEKRKLKNTSYNILASLNMEELEKYRQEKKEKMIHPTEEDLKELINTMTSATLAGDIKAASSLLSDLMATSIMDKIENPDEEAEDISDEEEKENENEDTELSLSQEVLDIQKLKQLNEETIEESEKITSEKDVDFYTRSMDLSDQDFELDEEFKEKRMPIGIKILITLIILIVIGAVAYFIYNKYL